MNKKPTYKRKQPPPIMQFVPFPTLATNRLTLRQMVVDDADRLFALRSNASVNQFLDRPATKYKQDVYDFIENINAQIANNELLYWVIQLNEDEGFAGTICLWNISKSESCGEVGYELHPDSQGLGIMQEAVAAVVAFAFNTIQLRTIVAVTREDNVPSIRLLMKKGFKKAPQRSDTQHSNNQHKKYEEYYLTKEISLKQ